MTRPPRLSPASLFGKKTARATGLAGAILLRFCWMPAAADGQMSSIEKSSASILGISAYYHDSAAALLVGGEIVAAAQEERFTRRKHDAAFPKNAADYCLRAAGLTAAQLDHVVFYEKPLLKFDRLLETYLAVAPRGLRSFMTAMPQWVKTKLHLPREIRAALGGGFKKRIAFTSHHESHAACAFFPSPYDEAAILTLDGVGEWDTASIGHGRGSKIELLETLAFPHSLGLLYSAVTYFCGFRVNSGEYKLMGLAPYGTPRFADAMRAKLLDLKPDGSLRLDLHYFNFLHGLTMTAPALEALFGGRPRAPESALTQREMDLAASVQLITEEAVLRMARHARELTGAKYLTLAGGVALNCVANGALLRAGIFDDVWIPGPAGDAGGALGAALFVQHQLLGHERAPQGRDSMQGGLLGPRFSTAEIRTFLDAEKLPYHHHADEGALLAAVVDELTAGRVVGWFQGRMEFGPRALGSRSILGDARDPAMQSRMNQRIKFRESFRPFAPSVLAEDAAEWFDLDRESPAMQFTARVKNSRLPAVTHVDGSARVQTVDEARHGRFCRLLRAFKARTGCSVLVNTSFNLRGEPIVGTPQDAARCFRACDMDTLVLEDCILRKTELPPLSASARQDYLASLSPD